MGFGTLFYLLLGVYLGSKFNYARVRPSILEYPN